MTAKPMSIKGTGCKFGGCVRKAVELTSGDLPFVLAFLEEDRGEAPKGLPEGTESPAVKCGTESPAIAEQWISGCRD